MSRKNAVRVAFFVPIIILEKMQKTAKDNNLDFCLVVRDAISVFAIMRHYTKDGHWSNPVNLTVGNNTLTRCSIGITVESSKVLENYVVEHKLTSVEDMIKSSLLLYATFVDKIKDGKYEFKSQKDPEVTITITSDVMKRILIN